MTNDKQPRFDLEAQVRKIWPQRSPEELAARTAENDARFKDHVERVIKSIRERANTKGPGGR